MGERKWFRKEPGEKKGGGGGGGRRIVIRERNLVNMCSMFDAADDEVEENAENDVKMEDKVKGAKD